MRFEWLSRAACRTADPGLFMDSHGSRAVTICAGCPVRAECMSSAVVEEWRQNKNSVATVRGGMSPTDRSAFRRVIERRLEPDGPGTALSRSGTV